MKVQFKEPDKVIRSVRSLFPDTRILVAGDIMLDRYLWGNVERISPEAPVPVVKLYRRSYMPGGAANVALNLSSLGFQVDLAGFVGNDREGTILVSELLNKGVNVQNVISLSDRPTITKTRVIGGHQQMVRVDEEDLSPYDPLHIQKLVTALESCIENRPGAVILSDYGKGVVIPDLSRRAISRCRNCGIPVLVDPKGADFSKYEGASAITPNMKELSAAVTVSLDSIDCIIDSGNSLISELGLDFMVVTRGEKGMILLEEKSSLEIPTQAKDVFDVSGAGDTVIATLAGALACGFSREDSVRLSNLAAGIVVGKVGTAPVEKAELLEALSREEELPLQGKIYRGLSSLLSKVERWRDEGKTIAFTNGCFDIIHSGHIMYLERSGQECNRLIVGVNSDDSVRRLKGSARPVNSQEDRMSVLAALSCVDAVVLFGEDTPLGLIEAIRPDVIVKGNDYTEEQVVGAPRVRSWGGRVVLVPVLHGRSTTGMIERIRNAE